MCFLPPIVPEPGRSCKACREKPFSGRGLAKRTRPLVYCRQVKRREAEALRFWKTLDARWGDRALWQFVKFNLVSLSITVVQLLLANRLPLLFDGLRAPLPPLLRPVFVPERLFEGESIYVTDGVVTWGYVLPFFLSNFLASGGLINSIIANMGGARVNFLADTTLFRPLLYLTHNWKEMGWDSIIYMAAIAAIDPTLYEAATVDGAGRMQQVFHVTLPSILSTIVILFILQVGRIMNAGFEQIFYMQNAAVMKVSDVLDTYIYSITFKATPNYGFSAAVGLFKSVINLFMLVLANFTVKKASGSGLFA